MHFAGKTDQKLNFWAWPKIQIEMQESFLESEPIAWKNFTSKTEKISIRIVLFENWPKGKLFF